jgi:predicted RNase H-like HicB family nuclease
VHQEDGGLWADVAELPGVFASGDDLDELKEAVTEAIQMYIAELSPEEIAALPTDGPVSMNVIRADFGAKAKRRPSRVSKMDMLIEA